MTPSNNLALARAKKKAAKLLKKKQWQAARIVLQEIGQMGPNDADNWMSLGHVAAKLNDPRAAQQAWQQVLSIRANCPQAHQHLAQLYCAAGAWEPATNHYRAFLALKPTDVEALGKLGIALEALGQFTEAATVYQTALSQAPACAEFLLGYGRVLRNLGHINDASGLIEQALRRQPSLGMAYLEQGLLLKLACRYDEAFAAFQRFNALVPQERETYLLNCASLAAEQEHYEESLTFYDQAVHAFPRSAYSHWARSLALLKMGRYNDGWAEFEWRRGYPEWQHQMAGFSTLAPQWQGESLAGKNVCVFAEQGFGDTLQFCRYLPNLQALGASVTFYCQPELYSLLSNIPNISVVKYGDQQVVGFDVYVPIMSLAGLLGVSLEDIKTYPPYIDADPEKMAHWEARLQHEPSSIGLVWAGSASNPLNHRRSIELATYAPLKDIAGMAFYSLQQGLSIEAKQGPAWQGIVDLDEDIQDFADTAAIIANLDLVITTDTAVAHLAGAMGRPCWVLIYSDPDWRWHGGDAWYPGLRLFKQAPGEHWSSVIGRVTEALKQL